MTCFDVRMNYLSSILYNTAMSVRIHANAPGKWFSAPAKARPQRAKSVFAMVIRSKRLPHVATRCEVRLINAFGDSEKRVCVGDRGLGAVGI